MGTFLKDNKSLIISIIVNQIGMIFFGTVVSFATAKNDLLSLLASIFAVLFYMVLLYMKTWQYGAEDKIKTDAGRMKREPLKGLYAGLCANALNILLGLGVLVGYFCATKYTVPDPSSVSIPSFGGSYLGAMQYPSSPQWAAQLYTICKTVAAFVEAMYNGIIGAFFRFSPFIYLLIVLPALFFCTLGYFMGLNERKIFGIDLSKNSKT